MDAKNEIESGLVHVSERAEKLNADMDVITQGRSNFALEHFVVGSHDCAPQQWAQAVLEMSILRNNIDLALIKKERIELDLEDIKDRIGGDINKRACRRVELDRAEKLIELRECERSILGYLRQFKTLAAIWENLPRVTYEELQASDERYWRARLGRQAVLEIAATGRVGVGNLDAIRQAGWKPAEVATIFNEAAKLLNVELQPQLEDKNG